jgi:hypothetical protein
MRLVIIDNKEVKVYDNRKFIIAFEYQPLTKEEIEYVRTDKYE